MLCILKALIAWAAMVFISVNLVGFIVRGLMWAPPSLEDVSPDGLVPTDRVLKIIEGETRRMRIGNALLNLLTWAATAGYLFALYRYWGLGLAVAGVILMFTRLPDLLWEIRTGTGSADTTRPSGVLSYATTVATFATLPFIWYSLCK